MPTLRTKPVRLAPHRLWSSEELAVAARGGDNEATGELYRRIRGRARRAASSFCRVSDVDDAVSEGLATALLRIEQLRDPAAVEAWLVRCAIRTAIDFSRRARRRTTVEHAAVAAGCGAGPALAVEPAEGPVLLAHDRQAMAAAVSDLPAPQRDLLRLRYQRNWSVDDIAAATGRPAGTIRRQCLEARQRAGEQFLSRQLSPAAGACAAVTRSLCREPYRRPAGRERQRALAHLRRCARCRGRQRELESLLFELGVRLRPGLR